MIIKIIICSILINTVITLYKSKNLIKNGYFSQNDCPQQAPYCSWIKQNYNNNIQGWQIQNSIIIAYGYLQSSSLSHQRAIKFTGPDISISQRLINMQQGYYQIDIKYLSVVSTQSVFYLLFNDIIQNYTFNSSLYLISKSIQVNLLSSSPLFVLKINSNATNLLLLSIAMYKVQLPQNLIIYTQIPYIPALAKQQNLLLNGDFSNNNCTSTVCFCQNNYYYGYQNYIYNWFPNIYFYIGTGANYNKFLGQSNAIKLYSSLSYCIQQTLTSNLTIGKYQLHIIYAPELATTNFMEAGLLIYFNGITLKQLYLTQQQPKYQIVRFYISSTQVNPTLRICPLNSYGIIIKQIVLSPQKIVQVQDQQKYPIFQCPSTINPDEQFFQQSIMLSSSSSQCKKLSYSLNSGTYQLKFTYSAFNNTIITNSFINVQFNSVLIGTITPNSQNQQFLIYTVSTISGNNFIEFCTDGSTNDLIYYIMISNFKVQNLFKIV